MPDGKVILLSVVAERPDFFSVTTAPGGLDLTVNSVEVQALTETAIATKMTLNKLMAYYFFSVGINCAEVKKGVDSCVSSKMPISAIFSNACRPFFSNLRNK